MNCEEMVQVGDEFKRQHYIKYPICDTNCGDKCEFKKKNNKKESKQEKQDQFQQCVQISLADPEVCSDEDPMK